MPESPEQKPYSEEEAREEAKRMQESLKKLGPSRRAFEGSPWWGKEELEKEKRRAEEKLYVTAEKLAEMKAEVVGVAAVDNEYRAKKLGEAFNNVAREKEKSLESIPGLSYYFESESYDEPAEERIKYEPKQGKTFDRRFSTIREYLLRSESYFTRRERAVVETFRKEFDQLPHEVQQGIKDYVDWYENTNGVGMDLEACYKARLIKKDQYQNIKDAQAAGDLILSGKFGKRFMREPRMYYWAVVRQSEKEKPKPEGN